MFKDTVNTISRRFTDLVTVEAKDGPAKVYEVLVFASVLFLNILKAMPIYAISLYCKLVNREGEVQHVACKWVLKAERHSAGGEFVDEKLFNGSRAFVKPNMLIGVKGTTGPRTKCAVTRTGKLAGIAAERLATLETCSFDLLNSSWRIGPFCNHALLATKPSTPIIIAAEQNMHELSAVTAGCFDALSTFGAFQPFVKAFGRAKSWRVIFHDRRRALESFAAHLADKCNWHNKIPPVRDARVLDNGAGPVRELSFSEWLARPFLSLVNYNISDRKVQVGGTTYGT